ncbi:MAG: tRNA (adenosine(37)-N6)-threonylcarbamoyltransferase complex ATPase subunit type 1 TsaE [Lentisphaeria bacterium]|jgi:tRNA threonylcarbamoyladenosine biosynthesis protein TsaE
MTPAALHTWTTDSPEATEAFAHDLARRLPDGAVVTLEGSLGAGKTVFARGLARGLGITEPVTSPTFAIVQEYPRPDGGWFYHLDLYRIQGPADALAFGLEEFLFRPGTLTAIEWAERIAGLLAAEAHGNAPLVPVTLAMLDEHRHTISLPAKLAKRLSLTN